TLGIFNPANDSVWISTSISRLRTGKRIVSCAYFSFISSHDWRSFLEDASSFSSYFSIVFSSNCSVCSSCTACLRSEEHTSELQSRFDLVCRLLLEKKNYNMLH